MHNLVYMSSASELFSADELVELLAVARRNNEPRKVTGMLLYREGSFIQVLEGEYEDVYYIYNKVAKDPRHNGLIVLLDEPTDQRNFANWSMGFANAGLVKEGDVPGYTPVMEPFNRDELRVRPSDAMILLKSFRDMG